MATISRQPTTIVCGNITMVIPARWYVFGNQRASITGTDGRVTISRNGMSIEIEVINGAAQVDLSPLLRMELTPYVNQKAERGTRGCTNFAAGLADITITQGGNTATASVLYQLGSYLPNIGTETEIEDWTTYNPHFPFLYNIHGTSVAVSVDGVSDGTATFESVAGGIRIAMDEVTAIEAQREITLTFRDDMMLGNTEYERTKILHCIVDDSPCGECLRWLDPQGNTRYHVFKRGNLEQSVSNSSYYSTSAAIDYGAAEDDDVTLGAARFRDAVNVQRQITLASASTPRELIPELMTLVSSDFVEMLMSDAGDWMRVNVVDAQTIQTSRHRQDFTCVIAIQTLQPQTI